MKNQTFLFLPPLTETTRLWAKQLQEVVPQLRVLIAENIEMAEQLLVEADAAYGEPSAELLAKATRLRWLQAPYAAPPEGFFAEHLLRHSATLTNFRGIYNDHIAVHVLAWILAFARGMHRYG